LRKNLPETGTVGLGSVPNCLSNGGIIPSDRPIGKRFDGHRQGGRAIKKGRAEREKAKNLSLTKEYEEI